MFLVRVSVEILILNFGRVFIRGVSGLGPFRVFVRGVSAIICTSSVTAEGIVRVYVEILILNFGCVFVRNLWGLILIPVHSWELDIVYESALFPSELVNPVNTDTFRPGFQAHGLESALYTGSNINGTLDS